MINEPGLKAWRRLEFSKSRPTNHIEENFSNMHGTFLRLRQGVF
jgi:hypothetical protein